MVDFSQQVTKFRNDGIYNYQFDNVGNEIINASSSIFQQVYFSLPLGNFVYNNSKITSFYDVSFTEFLPISSSTITSSAFSQEAIDQINLIKLQNQDLQNQLNSIVGTTQMDSGSADTQAIKNIILELRIKLGQGITLSDFQTIFPYSPIPLESMPTPPS